MFVIAHVKCNVMSMRTLVNLAFKACLDALHMEIVGYVCLYMTLALTRLGTCMLLVSAVCQLDIRSSCKPCQFLVDIATLGFLILPGATLEVLEAAVPALPKSQ
jgi:hypothetical protein